jgi:tripartite-type tricarboxylate transporter receptor subunit TctC
MKNWIGNFSPTPLWRLGIVSKQPRDQRTIELLRSMSSSSVLGALTRKLPPVYERVVLYSAAVNEHRRGEPATKTNDLAKGENMSRKNQVADGLTSVCVAWLLSFTNGVAAEAPFYQGKNLVVVEGREAGGTGSLRTQTAMKFVQKYLPGNPTIMYQYVPGGGGTAAANHMANIVRRDGLTIANIGTGVYSVIFGAPGVRYKLEDFVFLGSPVAGGPHTLLIRPSLQLDSVEKLKKYQGLRFGGRSVGHGTYTTDRLMAFVLELKDPRWVLGYNEDELNLALERGEADARSQSVPSVLKNRARFIDGGYSIPIIMRNTLGKGAEVAPEFPQGRPTLDQFADTELKRAVLNLHNNSRPGSAIFLVPKGIPEPALKALRDAFNRMWQDPQFIKEYERIADEPADHITGEEIHRALQAIPKDPKVFEVYKQLITNAPLPPGR